MKRIYRIYSIAILLMFPTVNKAQQLSCFEISEVDSSLFHYVTLFGKDSGGKEVTLIIDRECKYPLEQVLVEGRFCDTVTKIWMFRKSQFSEDSSELVEVVELNSLVTQNGKLVFSRKERLYPLMPIGCFELNFYRPRRKSTYSDFINDQ